MISDIVINRAKKGLIGCELILYVSFLYLDIRGGAIGASSFLKYAGVWLCLLFSWLTKGDWQIRTGLLFTVAADYFLLFTESYLTGVLLFIGTQLCYSLWLDGSVLFSRRLLLRIFRNGVIAGIVLIFLQAVGIEVDFLLAATLFYFLFLVENTFRGQPWLQPKGRKENVRKCFGIGMCLFLLCDIQVGIFNVAAYLPFSIEASWLYEMSAIGMWACYLPAKVCIALAGTECK